MLLVVSLVGALAVAGMAFGAKPPPKPKKPKPGHPASAHAFSWHDTPTGSTASLRGLSAVSANVVWASGATATGGVVLRTTDRGATWQNVSPTGPATLQFRDIEAFGPNKAVDHVGRCRHGFPDLPHDRRRADLDSRLPEHRSERVLRLHDLLQQESRARPLRPAGRLEVPGHQDDGRRADLERRRSGRNASGAPGRVRLRSQRPVHDEQPRPQRVVRQRRVHAGTRLHLSQPRPDLDRERDADEQRAVHGDQRARLPQPAARARSRRRLRHAGQLSEQLRRHAQRRPLVGDCSPARRPSTGRARLGSTATRRSSSGSPAAT